MFDLVALERGVPVSVFNKFAKRCISIEFDLKYWCRAEIFPFNSCLERCRCRVVRDRGCLGLARVGGRAGSRASRRDVAAVDLGPGLYATQRATVLVVPAIDCRGV